MELKNRSFQYGKVTLAVRTQKKHQLQFVLKVAAVCTDTRVVEHATVERIGQWYSGQSNTTPRWDAVSSCRRRESCYGRRVAGARPAPQDLGQGYCAVTATVRWNLVYCETKTPRCHQLGELEHCPVGKLCFCVRTVKATFAYWKLLFLSFILKTAVA